MTNYRYAHEEINVGEIAQAILGKMHASAIAGGPANEAASMFLFREFEEGRRPGITGIRMYELLRDLDGRLLEGQQLINNVPNLLVMAVHKNLDSMVERVSALWNDLEVDFEMPHPSDELRQLCIEVQQVRATPADAKFYESREFCSQLHNAIEGLGQVFNFFETTLNNYAPKLQQEAPEKQELFDLLSSEVTALQGFAGLNLKSLETFEDRVHQLQSELITYFGNSGVSARRAFFEMVHVALSENISEGFVNDLRLAAQADRF